MSFTAPCDVPIIVHSWHVSTHPSSSPDHALIGVQTGYEAYDTPGCAQAGQQPPHPPQAEVDQQAIPAKGGEGRGSEGPPGGLGLGWGDILRSLWGDERTQYLERLVGPVGGATDLLQESLYCRSGRCVMRSPRGGGAGEEGPSGEVGG